MKLLLVFVVTLASLLHKVPAIIKEEHQTLLGGYTDLDVNSEAVQKAAKLCLDLFDDSNTQGLAQRVREVLHAESQVVSGWNFKLKVRVGLLGSPESEAKLNSAVVKTGVCDFLLYEQTWTNTTELNSWQCGEFVNI